VQLTWQAHFENQCRFGGYLLKPRDHYLATSVNYLTSPLFLVYKKNKLYCKKKKK